MPDESFERTPDQFTENDKAMMETAESLMSQAFGSPGMTDKGNVSVMMPASENHPAGLVLIQFGDLEAAIARATVDLLQQAHAASYARGEADGIEKGRQAAIDELAKESAQAQEGGHVQ